MQAPPLLKTLATSACRMEGTFLYFGFGSNLLQERLRLLNPSAKFKTTAKLDNYSLRFEKLGDFWKGCSATVLPSAGDHAWGVVWELESKDRANLDRQEGVHKGLYEPFSVNVTTKDGQELQCLSYRIVCKGTEDHRPSPQYLEVIVQGAIQNKLPDEYIQKLKQIEHNGNTEIIDDDAVQQVLGSFTTKYIMSEKTN